MRRGDIVTVAGGVSANKPRPALAVQDDRFDATDSLTICPLTTAEVDAPLLRVPVSTQHTCGQGWMGGSRSALQPSPPSVAGLHACVVVHPLRECTLMLCCQLAAVLLARVFSLQARICPVHAVAVCVHTQQQQCLPSALGMI